MENFDLIIVGSGSGNSIPEYLADWRIALVEKGTFGGTCLNVGCIPSKMFVYPADVAESARHGGRLGVHASVNSVDWPAIRDRVFGRIDPIAAGGREYRATGSPNVELIQGTARFVGDKTFDVDGRTITAPKVLVAVGARPSIPDIRGLVDVRYHTSNTIMRVDEFPRRLGIIGGGFIAVELGHAFSGLGSAVTMFNRSHVLLRKHDGETAQRFTESFAKRVELHLNEMPTSVSMNGDKIVLHTPNGDHEVDELLVATGRRPNSDLVDVEAGGLTLDPRDDGTVVVDATMATNVPGVWAVGDVANPYQLKHLANKEAEVAFWNLAHSDQSPRTVQYHAIPHAVFSDPQIASVGLTEEEANEQGIDFVVGRRDYGGTAYGWAMDDSQSFAKVMIERGTRRLVGAHIMGSQAASLIQPIIQAMQLGTEVDAVAKEVFYIHPALTEVVENALLDGIERLDSV